MQTKAVPHEDWLIATYHETAGARVGPCVEPCVGPGAAAALGAADWLSLAAAPTWAAMALATGVLGDASGLMCLAAPSASPLTGMVPMYVLMSVFHAAPWLRLVAGRRRPR